MKMHVRAGQLAVLLLLCGVALAGTPAVGTAASPFTARVPLPRLGSTEYFQLLADGYALRASSQGPAVSVTDLHTGRQLWRRDPAIGHRDGARAVGGVLLLTGAPYLDADHQILDPQRDQTVALDMRTGRELWRHPGRPLRNGVGSVVALWCNGCAVVDTVGVAVATGQELWHSPWLSESNLFDGRAQWSVARDGTVHATDLENGGTRVVGSLPAGYWILQATDRYIMALPPQDSDAPAVTYASVAVFDRESLLPIAEPAITSTTSSPPGVQLCGELICQRAQAGMAVFDVRGTLRYSRDDFDLVAAARHGDRGVLLGGQSGYGRSGPTDTLQFLDAGTGEVLSDIGVWRFLRADPDRLWVGLFASRATSTMFAGPKEDARQPAILGYVDLRPGSPLTVTKLASLGGAYEDCDFAFNWLLCTNVVTGAQPVALRLSTDAVS